SSTTAPTSTSRCRRRCGSRRHPGSSCRREQATSPSSTTGCASRTTWWTRSSTRPSCSWASATGRSASRSAARRPAPEGLDVPPANPLRLTSPSGPVVRLNRRLLYVVAGVLVAVVVTGLIALRAQGSRDRGTASSRVDTRPAAERWFDKIPDREPEPRLAALDPLPPATSSPAPPPKPAAAPPAPKGPTPEELEAQRRERAERAAMGAPIGVATFERGTG